MKNYNYVQGAEKQQKHVVATPIMAFGHQNPGSFLFIKRTR